MRRRQNLTLFLTASMLSVALASAASGDVSLFEGTAGGVGDVRVYDDFGVTPPRAPTELQGIQLLPIDASGRSLFDPLLSDRVRLRDDVPSATRIVLPHEQGSVYRYRRDGLGGSIFGYFVIGADGVARSVFEAAGTGPFGTDDPLPGCVGIASNGNAMLFGTSVAAGGNLIEVDLTTGTSVDRTSTLDPLNMLHGGMRLLSTWGIALTSRGAVRFERAAGAVAAFVPLPTGDALGFVGDGVAVSADESTAAFVGGSGAGAAHVFTFRPEGSATQVTTSAEAIQGAGYLPQFSHGPTLALSADGSTVAWRTEGATTEAWVRPMAPGAPPALQVTDDTRFEDTLSETGAIGFFSNKLVLLVGSFQAPIATEAAGVEGADLYLVEPTTGQVTNLSLTSGQTQTPFTQGELGTENGIWLLPDSSGMLFVHDFGVDAELLSVPWNGALPTVLLDQVKSVEHAAAAGPDILFGVRRSNVARTTDLVRVPAGAAGSVLSSFSKDCDLDRFYGRADGTFAAVLDCLGSQWLGRAVLPSTSGALLTNKPLVVGPTLGATPTGSLVGSLEFVGTTVFFVWPDGATPQLLTRLSGAGHVLPRL